EALPPNRGLGHRPRHALQLELHAARGAASRDVHLLLPRGPVHPVRPAGHPPQAGRLHPGHQTRPADGAVPRSCVDAAHAARLALSGDDRGPALDLHQVRRLLAGELARARRHLRADRRRRRARHDEADGVADDDALLRRLFALNLLVLGPQGAGKGTQAKRISAEYDLPHISTGERFREEIAAGTAFGAQIAPIVEAGELVPDELTIARL